MPLPRVRGHVRFENVSFGYTPHQPVLHDVSFELRPGELVGVVGPSGSGKTTLTQLLARFYDVQRGQIALDGIDVRRLAGDDLRRHVGVVSQETFLFRGTIWDNLVYGRRDASIEQVLRASKAAGAHDFVMKAPLAYDTSLGEQGAGLSGGERQRLAIARALIYDPQVLILDEATSNVDVETELNIQEALRALTRGRTTLAIAHRLATLRDAVRILVFDGGRLVEQGPPGELLSRGGLYARLVRLQTQLTADPSVDFLHGATKTGADGFVGRVEGRPSVVEVRKSPEIVWLTPSDLRLRAEPNGGCEAILRDRAKPVRVEVVQAFPATAPGKHLSLRSAEDGDEIGLVDEPSKWPVETQRLVQTALDRRYVWPVVMSVERLELRNGYLQWTVETDRGRYEFAMRWVSQQAPDFGPRGKLLIDVDDNCYRLLDIDSFPPRVRALVRKYVYW